ncbi:MAG: rane dipeptidase [Chloroflexota bacterium]|jgi:microsomal dipeptidase-like Zn-dependent dipeptidase|nr:rane dipeptidase [Chloroflexota bacterium]
MGVRPTRRAAVAAAVGAVGLTLGGPILRRAVGSHLIARTERRLNTVADPGPYAVPPAAAAVHAGLTVVDLHADTLLFGRDLLVRGGRGHLDVPRLAEGNAAVEVFAVATKVPRHMNIDRNDDRSDDITLVAAALGWPRATWRSRLARAEHQAGRLADFAAASSGQLTVLRTAAGLDAFLERRAADRSLVAALLAIEGAHALDDEVANIERLDAAGYRMVGLSHFFDNAFAGSAHGLVKGGLTAAGRELVSELERRRIIVDVAHASTATIDDVLAIATRPVVASHTGVRAVADNGRNLTDDQLRGIAATGGMVGIGFWPTASGGDDAASIARSIMHAVSVVGADHVGLGSDFDGGVPTPWDVSALGFLTAALVDDGADQRTVAAVMGGTAIRFLRGALPPA